MAMLWSHGARTAWEQMQMIAHHLSFGRQVQATVVGLLAAVAAVILGAISKGSVELSQAAVLCASSVTTAFIAALSLGELFWFLRSNVQHSGAEKTLRSSWEAQVTSLWSDTGRRDAGSISPMSAAFTPSSSCLCFFSPRICYLSALLLLASTAAIKMSHFT